MSKCSKCNRNYDDETLSFCLEDGEKLVSTQFTDSNSTPTVIFMPKTAVADEPKVKSSLGGYLAFGAAGALIVLLAVGGMGFLFLRGDSTKNKVSPDVNNSQVKETPKPDETVKTAVKTNQCALPPSINEDVAKISFSATSYKITEESLSVLPKIAETLKQLPDNCVTEIGIHSDNVGNAQMNKKLTEERAKAVKNELVKYGVKVEKITAIGYGDSQPIADNSTIEGKAKNRRVELKVKSSEISQNNNSGNILDLTNPDTLADLKNKGLTIRKKDSSGKPNPLLLLVTVSENGDLSLNSEKEGNILSENTLASRLENIFSERERNGVFKEGTNLVEKMVIIKSPLKINREIFEKTYKAVQKSGADPIPILIED